MIRIPYAGYRIHTHVSGISSVMRTSNRMLKQVRRVLAIAFLFTGAINLLMLAAPLYALQIFEAVVPFASIETLGLMMAIAAVALLAIAAVEVARDTMLLRAGLWLDHELGQHLIENGIKSEATGAEISDQVQALEKVRRFLTSSALTSLFDAPFVPIFILALAAIHPVIGLVALLSATALVAAALLLNRLTSRLEPEYALAAKRSSQWSQTIANNAKLAGALGLARGAGRGFERANRAHVALGYSIGKRAGLMKSLSHLIRLGSQIALYGVGAWLIIGSQLSPGLLVAAAILLARALAPLENLVGSVRTVRGALVAYRRLRDGPVDVLQSRISNEMDRGSGLIELSDVTVYHSGRKAPALRSVSLQVQPGHVLAIVGPNGSGKSTLAAVIAGAISPVSGSATLDGLPVGKWQRSDGRPRIGYLPDDPMLIEGTVHDNIARFTEASQMAVAGAAIAAGVHDDLAALPNGYDTQVGPGGAHLALRERRAVALARAFSCKPGVIVLDEPELGLDGGALRRLVYTLERNKSPATSLVIATQDPGLVALADSVLVLHQGAVQAYGSSDEIKSIFAQRRAAGTGVGGALVGWAIGVTWLIS